MHRKLDMKGKVSITSCALEVSFIAYVKGRKGNEIILESFWVFKLKGEKEDSDFHSIGDRQLHLCKASLKYY